jgi:predicted AAA+ superfamily ATPase
LQLLNAEERSPALAVLASDARRDCLEQRLWCGGFPALYAAHRQEMQPSQWFAACVPTYIERDVRQVLNVGILLTFQRIVSMCAARSGQLLNLNSLAGDCGIAASANPLRAQWLTVLQACHLVAPAGAIPSKFRQAARQDTQTVFPGQRAVVPPTAHHQPRRPVRTCLARRRIRDLGGRRQVALFAAERLCRG